MIDTRDLRWFAGLMEGEGYFGLRPNQIVIALSMTDHDVVNRAASIFGFGHRRERKLPSGKVAYIWQITNQAHAAGLMMTLLPLMGKRRAEKIRECLAQWKSRRPNGKYLPECEHGHPLSGDNLKEHST